VHAEPLPRFPTASVWNQDISAATARLDSATTLAAVQAQVRRRLHGLRLRLGRMQIDFSLRAGARAAGRSDAAAREARRLLPAGLRRRADRDPVPAGATIEGQDA
jgi:hypothetical protein